ncbi:L-arabinonate dehydratase [Bordetella genomosp. 12]|uniref:Dihydroxy-acid dehydratase n=1 Tax=Bordetella genomosp. 12 TaxID=463035 RepID=A0A261VCG1_9BORD|nr:L-arabinonate dehydratase [Bordetella genomosp. 12]OZI71260.1 dihydroxy-acid dehydratase [Bordetella genomosp. 12]
MKKRSAEDLRSQRWFGADTLKAFMHRQRMQQVGHGRDEFVGRPIVAILNTWSGLSPCHAHLRDRAESVARGVIASGGFPVELPVMSLGEVMVKPTTMLYRNMLAMETEEVLRSHPVDGAILLGGCDKTGPGMIMGAVSAGLPCMFVPAGPMINATWRGEKIGAGTHSKQYWEEYRAGTITQKDWIKLETGMTRSVGTCNVMGTASTMTLAIEALGLSPMGAASIPAVDADHQRMATAAGRRIVDLIWEDCTPAKILSRESFLNAIVAIAGCGGSTNAAIHIIAMARRAGFSITLADFDAIGRKIPLLVNLMPAGEHLMADFHFAGGLPAVLNELRDHLHLEALTVSGQTLGSAIADAEAPDRAVIRTLDTPVSTLPAYAVVRGNLAPDGAVIKPTAATARLLQHRGPALVFENPTDMTNRIDDPALEVTEDTVLVLRNAGPLGGPGMPEWGNLPMPKRLLAKGVRDMVRISDARMSGTHYGTCVLHVAPEAAIGGPLALVQDGDIIELSLEERRLSLLVSEEELARRRKKWKAPAPTASRGYSKLFAEHVTQAPEGCDFDFLEGAGGVKDFIIY